VLEGFHIGMRSQVCIETAMDIGAAESIIVVTLHFGVQCAIEDAVVKAVNVVAGWGTQRTQQQARDAR
jgi:hypothetical protein